MAGQLESTRESPGIHEDTTPWPRLVRSSLHATALLASGFLAGSGGRTQAATITPDAATSQVQFDVAASGRLFAAGPGGAEHPIEVTARFVFRETPMTGGVRREYEQASALISRGETAVRKTLADDAGEVLVTLAGASPRAWLADGFLSHEEAELLDTPFDPLLAERLRPDAAVGMAESWELPDDVVAGLAGLDAVDSGGLEAKLESVEDGLARLRFSGTVVGRVDSTTSRLTVEGTATAAATPGQEEGDWLIAGPLSRLEASIEERREPGWVSPGIDVRATVTMHRTTRDAMSSAVAATGRLAAAAVDRPRGTGSAARLWHRHTRGRYTMVVDARWRMIEDGPEGLVMRLIDPDGMVAQCSLVPLPRAAAETPPVEGTVQADVRRSLGDQFGHFTESEAVTRDDGTRIVRVVAEGAAADRPFRWVHHVLTGPGGHQIAVTCMLEPALAERFAAADRELVAGLIVLPDPPARTAGDPGSQDRR